MIVLLSASIPTFMIQEADAAADITYTVATTTRTTLTVTFSEAMDSAADAKGEWTITNGQDANGAITSEAHTDGQTTMVLTLTAGIDTDATPTVTYAENGIITDTNAGATDTIVVGGVVAPDTLAPVIDSAATTSSTTIQLVASEALTQNDLSASVQEDFELKGLAGNNIVVNAWTYDTVGTEKDVITLYLSGPILSTDNPTVTYVSNAANDLEDIINIDLADFTDFTVTNNVASLTAKVGCYDCTPPTVQTSQITTPSDSYTITSADELTHITANVGDEISLLLKITDNKSIETIPFVGLYTNFVDRPGDMSLFYINNPDSLTNTSASFYEWNIRSDDVAYDYDGSVSWTILDDPIIEDSFMIQFNMKFNDSMETSEIMVKSSDAAGNYSYEALPVTLEVIGDTPIDFNSMGEQIVLGFFDESVLSIMISELNTSDNITTPLSALLGIADDSLPTWTSDLAKWTAEDKITSGDLIVAAEYLINL
mgnify:FL=1